jgi:NADP-dependent 3-hydroxy acid dehydrogenase YdfG
MHDERNVHGTRHRGTVGHRGRTGAGPGRTRYVPGLVARGADRLQAVLEDDRQHSPSAAMWLEDLGDPTAANRVTQGVPAAFGALDVLANNANTPGVRHVSVCQRRRWSESRRST